MKIGGRLPLELVDLARSAYVVDLADPTTPSGFARWVSTALESWVHTIDQARGPSGLVELDDPQRRAVRTYDVAPDVVAAVDAAITRRHQSGGELLTRSEVLEHALMAAVEATRRRWGLQQLPPAPRRLPPQPIRAASHGG